MFTGIAAKIGESVLLGKLKSTVNKVPAWLWWVIGIIVSCVLLIWLHSSLTANFERQIRLDQKQKDDAAWNTKLNVSIQDANTWRSKYEAASGQLTNNRRNANEEALLSSATHAGSLLTQGPGHATCTAVVNTSTASASSPSGHEPTNGTNGSGLDSVSPGQRPDLIAVPYNDFIAVGRSCDANHTEVNTWRSNQSEQEILYNQLRNSVQSGK